MSGDLYGNITLFGVAVDHLLPNRSPDKGSFVIILSFNKIKLNLSQLTLHYSSSWSN